MFESELVLGDKFEEDEMKILADSIPELEEEWSATRYPGWQDDRLWIPSESYTIDDAIKMKSRMIAVSGILKKFLKEKHGIMQ